MNKSIESSVGKYFYKLSANSETKYVDFHHSVLEKDNQVDLRCEILDHNLKLIHENCPAIRLMFSPEKPNEYIIGNFIKINSSISLIGDNSVAIESVQVVIEGVGLISLIPISSKETTLAGYTSITELPKSGMWEAYVVDDGKFKQYLMFHTMEKGIRVFSLEDIFDVLNIPKNDRKVKVAGIGMYVLKGAAAITVKEAFGGYEGILKSQSNIHEAISTIEFLEEISDAERISILEILRSKLSE